MASRFSLAQVETAKANLDALPVADKDTREVGLQAAINLNRGITGAEDAFALCPFHQGLGETAREFAERLQTVVIHPHQAESAKARTQIRRKLVQFREHLEVLRCELSVVDVSGLK